MKKKMRLRPYVLPTLYLVMVTLLMMLTTLSSTPSDEVEKLTYVSSVILSNDTPVLATKEDVLLKPVASSEVTIGKHYYDYQAEAKDQENSLIYYDGTYIQNSGVDYVSEKEFQIVAILDGVVVKVDENDLLGKIIEIKHSDNLISTYECLGNIDVKENQTIKQGNVIATSGSCKISTKAKNNLHFELFSNGEVVNPEKYFNKSLKDIKN